MLIIASCLDIAASFSPHVYNLSPGSIFSGVCDFWLFGLVIRFCYFLKGIVALETEYGILHIKVNLLSFTCGKNHTLFLRNLRCYEFWWLLFLCLHNAFYSSGKRKVASHFHIELWCAWFVKSPCLDHKLIVTLLQLY